MGWDVTSDGMGEEIGHLFVFVMSCHATPYGDGDRKRSRDMAYYKP